MKILKEVTVICIECYEQGRAISSIRKTLNEIKPARVVLLTDIFIQIDGIEVILIPKINSKEEYSNFCIRELYKYFDTSHCLLVQHDSWVLDSKCWDDRFYDYDMIGARWGYKDGRDCGNGGFSLKSHRLQKILSTDKNIEITSPEDEVTGRLYRHYLELNHGIKFPPDDICDKFSFELIEPINHTFGFHSNFWGKYKDHVVIKRTAAMGDCVLVEPLIQYYHDKGFQVVLDTLPEIMHVFFNHPFKIKHISEMNPNIVPIKTINLDGSYESKPKQRVLETYYEFAGIKDGVLRNARLNVNITHEQRLFKKYIVFHIDKTGMKYRDAYGVNWAFVAWHFTTRFGYTCIQVGKGSHEEVGTYFNTETKEMLMYLLSTADAVVGIDSGVAQLSVALGRPTAILTGSVDLSLRYVDFEKIEVIKNPCPNPEYEYCYHSQESSVTGSKCKIDEDSPVCTRHFTEWQVIAALNKLLKLN